MEVKDEISSHPLHLRPVMEDARTASQAEIDEAVREVPADPINVEKLQPRRVSFDIDTSLLHSRVAVSDTLSHSRYRDSYRSMLSLYPRLAMVNTSSGSSNIINQAATGQSISNLSQKLNARDRPLSILSIRRLDRPELVFNEPLITNSTLRLPVVPIFPPADSEPNSSAEYHQYLLLQQRHSSSNFISKVLSTELLYPAAVPLKLKTLGSHLCGGKIGKGAYGKVKEGLCVETLERVAVKVIVKKRVRKMVGSVVQEIKLLRRLKHENIVTLVDVFAKVEDSEGRAGVFRWFETIEQEPIVWIFEDGSEQERSVQVIKWYIVMRFAPCSLQSILDHAPNHRIDLDIARSYLTQIVLGIGYLHSQSVVHRDIKPGNILISTDGVVKITDFGIAEQFEVYKSGRMNCQAFAGTNQFISPEVITDESVDGFDGIKVDVYAAGVVLYNMVCGYLPFEFDQDYSVGVLHDNIVKGDFKVAEDISAPLEALIRGMMDINPDTRFDTETVLNHEWTTLSIDRGRDCIKTYHLTSDQVEEDKEIECETTMEPYMEQMYLHELDLDFQTSGYVSNAVEDIQGTRKTKLRTWIRGLVKKN